MVTNWVLLKKDEKDPGYYICRHNAGYPRRVINSHLYIGADFDYFAIDNMREGDVMQMWKLVPV
ncbi:hypothetical protein L208DRAFT_1406783 [Tricholoma matsutake]|nr:hypothetical protein L208DRAFT_1406783 [Tricholoma matsutake 945]